MSAPESTPRPEVLDYALNPRRGRMRWLGRLGLAALTLLATIGVIHASHKFITLRYHEWYWYQKCMTHVTPGGTVLAEWDSNRAQKLFTTNPEYLLVAPYGPNVPSGGMIHAPGPGSVVNFAIYVPIELREFDKYARVANFEYGYGEPVFLGERRRPDGQPRLVVIRGSTIPIERFPDGIRAYVCAPPTLLNGVPPATVTAKQYASSVGGLQFTMNLLPGIADAVDHTHITITEAGGQIVDAYLQNDDTLTYSLRKTPQKP